MLYSMVAKWLIDRIANSSGFMLYSLIVKEDPHKTLLYLTILRERVVYNFTITSES